jgi:hypothetical protein
MSNEPNVLHEGVVHAQYGPAFVEPGSFVKRVLFRCDKRRFFETLYNYRREDANHLWHSADGVVLVEATLTCMLCVIALQEVGRK